MSTLAETGTLIRMVLRRDRVRLPIWIVAIVVTVVGTAAALPESFPTAEARQARAELVDGPAIRMLVGPAFGTDDYSYGAMLHNEVFGTAAVAVALMSIFTLVRHTRADALQRGERRHQLTNETEREFCAPRLLQRLR